MTRVFLIAFGLLLATPLQVLATNLSATAAALAPGRWVELTGTTSFNGGSVLGPPNCPTQSILQYNGKAVWNPVAKRYQYAGAPHTCSGPNWWSVFYDDASNTWGSYGNPVPSETGPEHGFDQNAIRPDGTHYVMTDGSTTLRILPNGGSWTSQGGNIIGGNPQFSSSNEWFPDYLGGRLIHVDGDWGVYAHNPVTNTWTCIANGNIGSSCSQSGYPAVSTTLALSSLGTSAIYSFVCQCVLIGGGSGFYRLDRNGVFTAMNRTGGPAGFGTGGGDIPNGASGQWMVDPVTGKFLHLYGPDGLMREFDPLSGSTGTWRMIGGVGGGGTLNVVVPAFMNDPTTGIAYANACVGIPDYGVVMCVKTTDIALGRVFLYKHAASTPAQGPSPPTNMSAR
jgi:hypothetical protein